MIHYKWKLNKTQPATAFFRKTKIPGQNAPENISLNLVNTILCQIKSNRLKDKEKEIMNKNMRTWVIGICVAWSSSWPWRLRLPTTAAALMTDRPLKARQKAPLRPQRHRRKQVPGTGILKFRQCCRHSGHNGHMNASGDDLSRYLTEQDSIMMNMMEDGHPRKIRKCFLDFLRAWFPTTRQLSRCLRAIWTTREKAMS